MLDGSFKFCDLVKCPLAAGDRLAVDYAQAIQNTAGLVVTACLSPQ